MREFFGGERDFKERNVPLCWVGACSRALFSSLPRQIAAASRLVEHGRDGHGGVFCARYRGPQTLSLSSNEALKKKKNVVKPLFKMFVEQSSPPPPQFYRNSTSTSS